MMNFLVFAAALCLGVANGAEAPTEPQVVAVNYADPYDNDFPLLGYVSIPDETPAPAVVIVPDWNNVDEYEQIRATMMNEEFGWIGFAADIYGPDLQDGVENTTIRREQAGLYRGNNTLFYGRIQAAVDLLKNHPDVMPDKIAVIGYCFGGTGVLTYSFLGATDVVGAVSFHGGLTEFPVETPINHPVLVLSGGADDTGTEVEHLENQLNMANATWQITRYSGIEHSFTVWDDARGRYNKRADTRSWQEMASFLGEAFGSISYGMSAPEETAVEAVEYNDGGFDLTGYLAKPEGAMMGATPAVVIIPDWDGVSGPDGYEAGRATLLAQEGYVALAADIFGSDNQQVELVNDRIELMSGYYGNDTFISRIQAAVDLVAGHELVDKENIFLIGYCFGGTGAVEYAFSGLTDVKAIVPFHGGLTRVRPLSSEVYPWVMVQSGGEDAAHGNNTELEMELNMGNATWEISRYSGVLHGFTVWGGQAYNALADWRSWDAMLDMFGMILGHDSEMDGGIAHDDGDEDHDHSGEDDHDHGDEETSTNGGEGTSTNGGEGTSTNGGEETSTNGDDTSALSGCKTQLLGNIFSGVVLLSFALFH